MSQPTFRLARHFSVARTIIMPVLVLLWATSVMGGCAGTSKSPKTQEDIEKNPLASSTASPSIESRNNEEEGIPFDPFDEPFDPFAEDHESQIEEYDPFETVNSAIFEFNYRLDKYVVKPAAKVLNFFVPPDAQQSIANVFQNIRFVPRLFNNLLQGKFQGAGIEVSRFLINTTLGVGGLFDPAGIMFDLKTPPEDLGQTLGKYGVPNGPYLMIPLWGPFTLRDGLGFVGDWFLDPFNWLVIPIIEIADAPRVLQHDPTNFYIRLGMQAAETVNARALTLEKFQGVEEGTLDLYGAIRNAYYQQRLKALRE